MSDFLEIINSSGLLTIITLVIGFFTVSIRYCFISKCTHCNLCFGMVDITRDAELENEELEKIDLIPNEV